MRYLVLIAFACGPSWLEAGRYLTTTPEAAAPFLANGWLTPAS